MKYLVLGLIFFCFCFSVISSVHVNVNVEVDNNNHHHNHHQQHHSAPAEGEELVIIQDDLASHLNSSSEEYDEVKERIIKTPNAHCYITGDSIAVGMWNEVFGSSVAFTHACSINAKIGIASKAITLRTMKADFDWVYISAGTNPDVGNTLAANLETIRAGFGNVKHFIWASPTPKTPGARAAVEAIATKYNDHFIRFTPGPDGYHPKSYNVIVAEIQKFLANPSADPNPTPTTPTSGPGNQGSTACTVGKASGICMDVGLCKGKPFSHKCAGPSNVQCCILS